MTTLRDAAMQSKAWPFEEARRVLKRYEKKDPEKGYVLVETGYGPSGLPHIGTFGEVARTTMIRRAFQIISDIPTRLFCFSDDMDGMRKVPENVPNQEMLHQHLQEPPEGRRHVDLRQARRAVPLQHAVEHRILPEKLRADVVIDSRPVVPCHASLPDACPGPGRWRGRACRSSPATARGRCGRPMSDARPLSVRLRGPVARSNPGSAVSVPRCRAGARCRAGGGRRGRRSSAVPSRRSTDARRPAWRRS